MFVLHFGFFHLVYLVFLLAFTFGADAQGFIEVSDMDTDEVLQVHVGTVYALDLLFFAGISLSFWLSHRASYREHLEADLGNRPNLGALMVMPYARVVPMHMCIILAIPLGGHGFIWLFVLLKTAADALMHVVEHRVLQTPKTSERPDAAP